MSDSSAPVPASPFRQAALEKSGRPDSLDLGVHIVRAPQWLLLAVMLAVLGAAVLFSFLIPVPFKVEARGILITAEGVKDIESVAGGRVTEIFVARGARVHQGQRVAQIEQPDLTQQLETAQADLDNLRSRQARVIDFHRQNRSDLEAQLAQKRRELETGIETSKRQVEWLAKALSGYEELARKGFASQQKLFETQVKLNEARAELIRTQNSLNSLKFEDNNRRIEREREMLDREVKIEQASRAVEALQQRRQRMTFVESPYDGVVVEQKLNLGEIVDAGKPILSVLPGASEQEGARAAPLTAKLYVPSAEGKKVQPGMQVYIVPSTVKREEFGFIYGRIKSVASVPSTPEGMMRSLRNRQLVDQMSSGGAPFEVEASLEVDAATPSGFRWSSSQGPDQIISAGSLANAQVIVREQRMIALVMPALRRLLGDLAQ